MNKTIVSTVVGLALWSFFGVANAATVTRLQCTANGGMVTLGGTDTGLTCKGGTFDNRSVDPNSVKASGTGGSNTEGGQTHAGKSGPKTEPGSGKQDK